MTYELLRYNLLRDTETGCEFEWTIRDVPRGHIGLFYHLTHNATLISVVAADNACIDDAAGTFDRVIAIPREAAIRSFRAHLAHFRPPQIDRNISFDIHMRAAIDGWTRLLLGELRGAKLTPTITFTFDD